jgi:hypothetical protein
MQAFYTIHIVVLERRILETKESRTWKLTFHPTRLWLDIRCTLKSQLRDLLFGVMWTAPHVFMSNPHVGGIRHYRCYPILLLIGHLMYEDRGF